MLLVQQTHLHHFNFRLLPLHVLLVDFLLKFTNEPVTWVKVQNSKNPELKKFNSLNLLDAYKNE